MRRLVFYVDPTADPLVEAGSVSCGDDDGPVNTSVGPVRAGDLVAGNYYKYEDGTCRRIDNVEVS